MRHALHAPGSIHGTASSLVSIPAAPIFFGPEESSELGANQWHRAEMLFSMHTQDGNIAATRFLDLMFDIFADNLYLSGLAPAMEAIGGDSDEFQGNAMEVDDATEADILQSDTTESNMDYAQANAINDTFERDRDLSDEGALESTSQGEETIFCTENFTN